MSDGKSRLPSCPNCGGPVTLRGFAHTLSVVCPQCLTVLDTSTPLVQILQTFQGKTRIEPTIPLGSRGKFGDTAYEAIGFQIREVQTEEAHYGWSEYLLFNPYKGFRYLSEYQGHWNFIRVAHSIPEPYRTAMRFEKNGFARFSEAEAVTTYVIGEFPWRVHVGDRATVNDYVSAPLILSSEKVENEVTWSVGEYYTGRANLESFPIARPANSGARRVRQSAFALCGHGGGSLESLGVADGGHACHRDFFQRDCGAARSVPSEIQLYSGYGERGRLRDGAI